MSEDVRELEELLRKIKMAKSDKKIMIKIQQNHKQPRFGGSE